MLQYGTAAPDSTYSRVLYMYVCVLYLYVCARVHVICIGIASLQETDE